MEFLEMRQIKCNRYRVKFSIAFLFITTTAAAITFLLVTPSYVILENEDVVNLEDVVFYSLGEDVSPIVCFERENTIENVSWDSTSPNPPLSARHAISIGFEELQKSVGEQDTKPWKLKRIGLRPIAAGNGSWCWQVEFVKRPVNVDFGRVEDCFSVFVMMDGQVLGKKKERKGAGIN